ncbi:MAG: glutamine synthetase family protein [Marivibrio sp.]|uniref:glutamine synthetase family protein n=1 Tax=Marivibrio sp. TaxID=2039719 RepID=UPI0032EEA270
MPEASAPPPSPDEEIRAFLAAHPDTKTIEAFIFDLCGVAMGKRYPVEDLAALYSDGLQMCAAACLLDVTGNSADPLGHGFSDGDPDADAIAIPGTLKPVPWARRPTGQVMLRLVRPEVARTPVWFEPREILSRLVQRFETDLSLKPVAAVELEFFLIDPRRTEDGSPQPPLSPVTGKPHTANQVYGMGKLEEFDSVLAAIEEACAAQGVPATAASAEYAPGQFELNLRHVSDAVLAADHACLLRRIVKSVARSEGYDATFMSKPYPDQSGSGLHVHLSLEDESGANVFDETRDPDETVLRRAVAGLQATMGEAVALFAPNLNAYRRFEPDQFTPVTKDWGYDNRSVAFRIPSGRGPARRIEHRVAGAEANPYLVMAAVIAGVRHGIERELSPSEPATGNAGAAMDESLPLTLWRALEALERAEILPSLIGADYLKAYHAVKSAEFADFMSAPSPREYDWYL